MGRHEHSPVTENGRQICRFCRQVIVKPILSSDDPRLEGAGFHRSGGSNVDLEYPNGEFPPLPEMLIALYFNAKFLGLPQAPKAPYIETVALEAGRRPPGSIDPDDIWVDLYRKWQDGKLKASQNAPKDDRPRSYTRGR